MYICVHTCEHAMTHTSRKVKRQLCEVNSLLTLFHEFWGSNSGQQAGVASTLT